MLLQNDLRTLLKQFRKGADLLNYFDRNMRMDSKHRSHLAECVVDFNLKVNNGKISSNIKLKHTLYELHNTKIENLIKMNFKNKCFVGNNVLL